MGKKRPRVTGPRIRGTYYLSQEGIETEEVRSLILRRRLQILIHSYIYYDLDDNLVSDTTWSKWARELVQLQEKYPKMARSVDYHAAFMGFDGSTGFDLPYRSPEIVSKAQQLIRIKEEQDGNTGHKTNRAKSGGTVIRLLFP